MNKVFLSFVLFFCGNLCLSSKQNPYGVSSFTNMIKNNYLYFDKTEAIEKIENFGRYLKLWRPKRCGKTLFCDQLALYYDKAEAKNKVFDNTYIGSHPTPEKSQYLVLLLSFSDVDATGDVESSFTETINREIFVFSEKYHHILKGKIEINKHSHISSMKNLFWAVQKAGERLYLIIDEYDSFANRLLLQIDTTSSDLGRSQYQSTVATKESMLLNFGNVLKTATRTVLDRMFFTGIIPIAFGDALSSLNMVKDISSYPEMELIFGYTEDEIKDALGQICSTAVSQKDIDLHFEIMRENFNGYRYHSEQVTSVFNPQMCLYYIDRLMLTSKSPVPLLDPNLASGSDSTIQFLAKNYRGFSSTIGPLDLLRARVGYSLVAEESMINFCSKQLFEKETVDSALLSLAFHHGYLTYANPLDYKNKGCLVCPNKVIQDILIDGILSANFDTTMRLLGLSGTSEEKITGDEFVKKAWKALKGKLEEYVIEKIMERLTTPKFSLL